MPGSSKRSTKTSCRRITSYNVCYTKLLRNKGALENGFYIPATGVAGGMRNLTNSVRPIKTVDDIKGLKMRTPPIDVTIRTFKAIGANPQEVPYTETYMALKTGVVDGQENPFSNIVDMKFYEAQKYLSLA